MAEMDAHAEVGGEDDFIFNEYAIDDTLDPLQRLVKYHGSDFSLQRLVLIRELTDTADFAGYDETNKQLLPLLTNFVSDAEPAVRQTFAAQLPSLAQFLVQKGGNPGYMDFLNILLPDAVELLVDKNVEVGVAALKALNQLAELVKPEHVETQLVQVLTTLAHDDRAEDYRVVAAQLFDDLSPKLGPDLCAGTVIAEVKTLAADASFFVRRAVASSLGQLSSVLGVEKADTLILPIYLSLCRDEFWSVRKACAESIVKISAHVSNESRVKELVPLFKMLSEDNSRWVRVAAYGNLGQFIHTMQRSDVNSVFLKVYTDMAFQSEGGDADFAEYCAFSFPAVAKVMGSERWRELDDAFATLLKDVQWKVRRSLAHSLHEVAKVVGPEIADKSLTNALDQFLRDLDEVKVGVIQNIDIFLEVLPAASRQRYVPFVCAVPLESENWRLRNLVASKLGAIAKLVPPKLVHEQITDLILRLLEDSVLDVRTSTYHSAGVVLQYLEECSHETSNKEYYDRFLQNIVALSSRPNFQFRQMFIYITQQAVELNAKKVAESMLEVFPTLAEDKVGNVRFVLARVLANSINNNAAWKNNQRAIAATSKLREDKERDVAELAAQTNLPRVSDVAHAAAYRPV